MSAGVPPSTSRAEGLGAHRRRTLLVLLLAVNSGATDAIGLLALGGAFTSVMTGNLVFTGIGLANGDLALVVLAGSAIVCYMLGCAFGARVAGTARADDPVWPRAVTSALTLQLAVTIAFAGGWWAASADPGELPALVLLVVNALALGIQSSAVLRFGEGGLATTYLTGTLTTLVVRLVSGHGLRAVRRNLALLGTLVLGAAGGAGLLVGAPLLAPVLPLACLGIVLVTAPRWLPDH